MIQWVLRIRKMQISWVYNQRMNNTDLRSPLFKAIRIAIIYVGIALGGFFVLILIALYVPDNFLLRTPASTRLKNWLPDKISFPQDMIYVSESNTTNEEVADDYPDEKELAQYLEDWGREEGYTLLFVSKDRCTSKGPRTIRLGVILHKDSKGARAYLDWLQMRDLARSYKLEDIDIGNYGYVFWEERNSRCSEVEKEIRIEVIFQRNYALGSVAMTYLSGENTEEEILKTAHELANMVDSRILEETTQR